MKSNLGLKIQGVRGGNPSWNANKGYVVAFIDGNDNTIIVDAFEGYDRDYKRRERCKITISHNDSAIFQGTFDDLVERLEK